MNNIYYKELQRSEKQKKDGVGIGRLHGCRLSYVMWIGHAQGNENVLRNDNREEARSYGTSKVQCKVERTG